MAQIIKLRKKDERFIDEYVKINLPLYKEMVRHTFPRIKPIIIELKKEFEGIYSSPRERELAVNYAQNIVMNILARRLR